jgi:hypothetical protein
MPTARALRYTPRYLLNSLFSMASKNLRYRSISKVAVGCRCDPYREYHLKEHCAREDIGSGILSGDYEKK